MLLGGLKKILVIDHSGLNRLQAKLILEKDGFTVLELDNANDYFRSFWNYTDVGLILLYFIPIPGLTGIDVLTRMKEYGCNPWPPVIIASNNPDAQMVASTIELGAKDCLIKSFNEEDLCRREGRDWAEHIHEVKAGKRLSCY